jgi:NADPH-dependent glutamate synthase beta subunit-like oxidoreductase
MTPNTITIDGSVLPMSAEDTVLHVARRAGLDIPTLCYLEQCGPLNTCQVCLVKVNGKLVPSCGTRAEPGMVVESETEEVHAARRAALELLFSDHVGDCLSPCHRLCPLHLNIPQMIRQIEGQRLADALQTVRQALPLAGVLGHLCHHPCEQGCRRGHWDDPAAIRDMERYVTDWDRGRAASAEPAGARGELSATAAGVPRPGGKPSTGQAVAVIGGGPAGLTAAWHLARQGHAVTVVDRNPSLGGSLRSVPETQLPKAVLQAELVLLEQWGIQLKPNTQLGNGLTLDGLRRGFNAILLAVGSLTVAEAARLGVAATATGLKANPNTGQTAFSDVFATGAAVKPVKQLIRAMAEGRATAECIDRFLRGQEPRRPEKPFSSVLGRLTPGELKQFLKEENQVHRVAPCDACAGFDRSEATAEAARCLHCDCRSSGQCALQHWANVYSANANRFRAERRPFEQQRQPGGILFEPGKCIVCGICVKLCEQAQEELGLTFVGRGFDVRVAAPFQQPIEAGLRRVAAECVKHCPTGALVFG